MTDDGGRGGCGDSAEDEAGAVALMPAGLVVDDAAVAVAAAAARAAVQRAGRGRLAWRADVDFGDRPGAEDDAAPTLRACP